MNNSPIAIKPVTVDGAQALSAIALRAYCDHYLHLWHDGGEWYKQKSFAVENLAAELKDGNARFYIIYANKTATGFLKINIDAPLGDELNALELERIYFTRQASGKGIGTKVVNFVFQQALILGKEIVWLKVMDSSTAAIAFYKKMGFETCGTYQLNFPQMKEELRGMYIMKKYLKIT